MHRFKPSRAGARKAANIFSESGEDPWK
jgi:hypothetical protein